MKSYHTLTHRGQVKRLKSLASAALSHYPLTPTQITPLTHLFNTTFRVDTANGRYVLRIGRPDFRTPAELNSEMAWLHAISRDTALVVPEPIANRQGEWLTTAEAPGVPEARACVLFRWVDGRFHRQQLSPLDLGRVGTFMARLHRYVESNFTPPAGFTRHHLGMDGEMGHIFSDGLAKGADLITQAGCDVLTQTVELTRPFVNALDRSNPSIYNLIHADLHQANYLFHQDTVHAIDFDDCGWGHFAYDMAVTFWYIRKRPNFPALRAAFLAGYRAERPFAVADERYLNIFLALRSVLMATYAATETNPKIRAIAPRFIGGIIEELQAFNQQLTGD